MSISNKLTLRGVIIIFVILFSFMDIMAQSDYGGFSSYGLADNMYHVNIKSLHKDSKGFLWVGSTDGLMRYDGAFFDVFRREKGKEHTLASNNISVIKEDKYSYSFWLGSVTGHISRFYIDEDRYENYYLAPSGSNKEGMVPISDFEQIGPDSLIVATQVEGLYLFCPSKNEFKPIRVAEFKDKTKGPLGNSVYHLYNDDKYLWITTSFGLLQLSLNGSIINQDVFSEDAYPTFYSNMGEFLIKSVTKVKEDVFAFFVNGFLYYYDYSKQELEVVFESTISIICEDILTDHKNNFWITTSNNGVLYLDLLEQSLVHHVEIPNNHNSLVDNNVSAICHLDDQEITWIGTSKGLSKYNYKASKFKQYDIDKLGVPNANIYLLAKDTKGGFWIGNNRDCYYKKKSSEIFVRYAEQGDKRFYAFAEDSIGNFLIGTDKGLLVHDLDNDHTELKTFKCIGLSEKESSYINDLIVAEDSISWLVSHKGLIKYNSATSDYDFFPFTEDLFGNITYYFSSITLSNDKKSIWFASRRGRIFKYDIEANQFSNVITLEEGVNGFNTILDIQFDVTGRLWIATYGSGLLFYDFATKELTDDMAVDILESHVYSVLKDNANQLWLSANMGIAKIDPYNLEAQYFYANDGTFCEEFNSNAFYKFKNNEILFGGGGRFICFNPNEIERNTYNAPVEISSWQVDDQVTSFGGGLYEKVCYNSKDEVEFEQTNNALRVYACVLDYSNSNRNIIKWRLKGFDDYWKQGYTNETIIYHNLDAGKYTLEVKGINSDGYESENTARLDIKVIAPFTQTLYFKAIFVILCILLVLLIIRFRFAWYRKQEILLTQKVKAKTKELTDANEELEASREKVFTQKAELEIHRNYLEELVKDRTKDLEAAKLKAEESDKLKTAFLANLSHEIRTPMNAIIGFSSLLQTDDYKDNHDTNFLNIIQQSSESLLALINDIIDISRIETGNIQLVKSYVSIRDIITDVSNELIFEEKSEEIIYRQSIDLLQKEEIIYTDPNRIKQILSNLLRNGFKFTKNGYVKLKVETISSNELSALGFDYKGEGVDNKALLLKVIDTGIGISEEELAIIFEPFRKGYNGYKFYQGMGLGLSIVKNLLSILNGDIIVESELNKGTTFTIYLEYTEE
ncbi:sensor histidine kinase [Saccharicrinis aurantiacus]|uniref:sensor histidine kinase n=1 Tax=Saccharicrinis aurantiacus TaxID=1849719 RepID=UPI0024908EE5|nr:hybrid sensor histidine kinase/response regulator [Saccharicrinis aurantiacus]